MFGIENDGRLCWNREKKSAQTNEHANNVNNTADIILFIVNIAYIYRIHTTRVWAYRDTVSKLPYNWTIEMWKPRIHFTVVQIELFTLSRSLE